MRKYNKREIQDWLSSEPMLRSYFLRFGKSKKKANVRSGTMSPDDVRKRIHEIGRGKKVNITRLSYDGTPEDPPVAVKIIDIGNDHFTGKFINVERSITEAQSDTLVYLKGGGGTVDFYFADGDIMSIEEDIDEEIMQQRNVDEVREILEALDVNDDVSISYYDKDKGGVINGSGKLIEKSMESLDILIRLTWINEMELDDPYEIKLNLDRDEILDLEIVI